MTRIAYTLSHVSFEDLGLIEPLLGPAGYEIRMLSAPLADLAAVHPGPDDLLVVLGGPIGAYEDDLYPFLSAELDLIGRALAAGSRYLGVCLGAQLLARALGAAVYPGAPGKEIGFYPLRLTVVGANSPLAPLEGREVLHWHGDTFDLPAGAERLASSALYENQAFRLGERILGLQFHIETDPAVLETWLVGHAGELAAAGVDLGALRAQARAVRDPLVAAGARVLTDWLG
ncbi:MAG: glutamine amidotransferase [Caulobacteraceae bacterium]|nr:glutamine amidotransferase [Caulobacteraceae bacterium]